MSATLTAICQHPDCDNEYVPKPYMTTMFCSPECGQDAYRRRNRGEAAAIVKSETISYRKSTMTDTEKNAYLAMYRAQLDAGRAHVNDRHWRRADIVAKLADTETTWTVGQLARFYGIDRADMQGRIREAKGAKP